MSVVVISRDRVSGKTVFTALSTDTLPHCAAGSLAYITDVDGRVDRYSGTAWGQISTDDAVNVYQKNNDPVPEYQVFEWEGAAGAADNAVLYTTPVDNYAYDTFTLSNDHASLAVAVQVKVHPDSAWSPDVAIHQWDNATDAPIVGLAATKCGYIKGRFYQIQVLQTGAGNIAAGDVNGTMSNSGGGHY